MKVLSVAIPCYNSQDYMKKCIESILVAKDDVEIIIVDDGSTDKTGEIADAYARKYPTIVKAVHKENGGHGDAVNHGLKNATGYFFKVVDSDDWLSEGAFKMVMKTLKTAIKNAEADPEKTLDVLLSNYVYDKVGRRKKRVMRYTGALEENKLLSWDTARIKFKMYQYVLMHSVIYRTQMLKDSGLVLPKHTFYVDNLYLFKPMVNVKTLMYLNVDLYRYFIGREGQSVNEQTMVKRIDQQIFVNKEIVDFFCEHQDVNPQLYIFLFQYMDMMMCVSSVICLVGGTKEYLDKKKELWSYVKKKDKSLYKKLRKTFLGISMNLPGSAGRYISKTGYKIVQKLFGFN